MTSIPEIGNSVPFFDVKDSSGRKISTESLIGSPYILYFYSKDETPGCTTEACQFRDKLNFLNIPVFGISPDSDASHQQFIANQALNFPLISDPNHELCSLFGVWEEKKSLEKVYGVTRTTFIIDSKGILRWMEKPVKVDGHVDRVLEALKNLSL